MSLLRFAAVSVVLLLAIGCSNNDSSPTTPSPTPSPTPTAGGASSSVSIPMGASTLGNRAFAPDDLSVAVGSTVTWMNTDSVSHTSTSDASGWNSGVVAPGGSFGFTFQSAGTFSYHCAIHPGMVGTVTVH